MRLRGKSTVAASTMAAVTAAATSFSSKPEISALFDFMMYDPL